MGNSVQISEKRKQMMEEETESEKSIDELFIRCKFSGKEEEIFQNKLKCHTTQKYFSEKEKEIFQNKLKIKQQRYIQTQQKLIKYFFKDYITLSSPCYYDIEYDTVKNITDAHIHFLRMMLVYFNSTYNFKKMLNFLNNLNSFAYELKNKSFNGDAKYKNNKYYAEMIVRTEKWYDDIIKSFNEKINKNLILMDMDDQGNNMINDVFETLKIEKND
jgi:hypothetical protein